LRTLENSPQGMISKQLLESALALIATKPIDYYVLNSLVKQVLDGQADLSRQQVRSRLENHIDTIKQLADM
jgi:hypothetical protein